MKELVYHRGLLPALENNASKTAFFDQGYEGTFEQHGDRVFRLCHALKHQLGVEPGDRFAVMATNSHEYLELYHAAFLGAGVINPLNLRLAGKELDYIVRDSGTEVVFVDIILRPTLRPGHGRVRRAQPDPPRGAHRRRRRAPRRQLRRPDRGRRAGRARRARGGRSGRADVHRRHHRAAQGRAARAPGRDAEPLPHRHGRRSSTPTRSTCTRPRCSTPRRWAGSWGRPSAGGTSVFMPLFDPGSRDGADRAAPGDPDGDGADDDRHDAQPSRVLARAAGLAAVAHLRRVADAGRPSSTG